MLHPKKKIAIVYGHDREVLNFVREKIQEYNNEGYRVLPIIVGSKRLRTQSNSSVFEGLVNAFKNIDAAIVFMTADDFGASKRKLKPLVEANPELEVKNILEKHLQERARQNVLFELGFIVATVGEGRFRVFADEVIEIPSDIEGRYLEKNFSKTNIAEVIQELIEVNLQSFKKAHPLEDATYRLDYSCLKDSNKNALDLFEEEYLQLDDDGERIIYLFERIVFDSYYQRPEWWQEKFRTLTSNTSKIEYSKKILEEIAKYMSAWRPPDKIDNNTLFSCTENIYDILNQLKDKPINPIIKIVAYDYLGLACQKIGILKEYFEQDERLKYLKRSKEALTTALELAKQYDDPLLPLWQGYASFNLAKTLHEIDQLSPSKLSDRQWREMFHQAILIRENWTIHSKGFPLNIREGLITEYLHAKAERIRRAIVDKDSVIIEKFPYAINGEFIEEAEQEYHKWETDPDHIRVRLATNLHESWGRIKERFKKES